MTSSETLKPCPFCGSDDVQSYAPAYVECNQCDAFGPSNDGCDDGIQPWNTRPPLQDAAPDLLAACEEFVRKCECGEARSVRSYAQMKAAIAKAKGEVHP